MSELNDDRRRYYRAFKCLTYSNASPDEVKTAVNVKIGLIESPKSNDWVKVIRSVKMACKRCVGTGKLITGVLNGRPVGPSGMICFRCGGHGFQTWRDGSRNSGYDNYAMRAV